MIDIYVLNTDFIVVGVIDTYESFIWTDRFNSYGDFELYTSFNTSILTMCQQKNYLYINQSEHMMIIEGIEIESDSEDGNKLKITGRSLESMIDRRIVWQQMTITANTTFQNAVKYLIQDAILDPQPYSGTRDNKRRNATQLKTSWDRKMVWYFETSDTSFQTGKTYFELINNVYTITTDRTMQSGKTYYETKDRFVFEETDDSYILGLTVEKTQYTGDNLYDILTNMFESVNNTIGYRIFLNDENQFVFKLYSGVDRSYAQKEYKKTTDMYMQSGKTYYELVDNNYVVTSDTSFQNGKTYYEHHEILPYVVFSPQFDNVINSNYIDSISEMKNVTLVAGEGEDSSRKSIIVGSEISFERRELFTDARDLKSSDYGNKYNDALKTRGKSKLVENARVTSYEGQVDATRQYVFGENFNMGDVIAMANEYGIEGNARVIEWVMSDSTEGIETYPTFDAVQNIDDTTTEEDNTDV